MPKAYDIHYVWILFIIKQNVDMHGGATTSHAMKAYVGIDES